MLADITVLKSELRRNTGIMFSIENSLKGAERQRQVLKSIMFKMLECLTSKLSRCRTDLKTAQLELISNLLLTKSYERKR